MNLNIRQIAYRAWNSRNEKLAVKVLVVVCRRLAKAGDDLFDLTRRYAVELEEWAKRAGLDARIKSSGMSESQYVLISDDEDFGIKVRISTHGKGGPFKIDFGHAEDDYDVRVNQGQHWSLIAKAISETIAVPDHSAREANSLASKSRQIAESDYEDAMRTEQARQEDRDAENTSASIEVFPANQNYGLLYVSQYDKSANAVVKRSGSGWHIIEMADGRDDLAEYGLSMHPKELMMKDDPEEIMDLMDMYGVPQA